MASHRCVEAQEQALFVELGRAWYKQLQPQPGRSYELESPEQVGRREFREFITRCLDGSAASKRNLPVEIMDWAMPPEVVEALLAFERVQTA